MSLLERLGRAAGATLDLTAGAVEGMQKALRSRANNASTLTAPNGRQPLSDRDVQAQTERLKAGEPAGQFYDTDRAFEAAQGFLQRPMVRGGGSELDLIRIAQVSPIAAVLATQQNGVAEYCTAQRNEQLPGYRIRLREDAAGAANGKAPSKAALKRAAELTRWLAHCGTYDDVGQLTARPNFETLARQVYADSFRFDAGVVQVVPERFAGYGGAFKPAALLAMDAKTIRLTAPPVDGRHVPDTDFDAVRYLQLDRFQRPVAGFTQRQLMYLITNPRTDIEQAGYGLSKVEMMVEAVTSYLFAHGYNRRYFERGTNIKGFLAFDGKEPPADSRRSFERYWRALVSGVENAHNVPMVWGENKPQWVPFGNANNRDMEFSAWMDFLLKLMCAICQIDPAEINFNFGNHNQSSAMGSASVAEKIAASRNRWLRPWLRSFGYALNTHVVWSLDADFELEWTGFDVESVDDTHKRRTTSVQHFLTVDEARAELDLPKLPDGKGEVILNTVWLQASQGGQAGAEPGAEGEGVPPGQGGQPAGEGADDEGASDDQADGAPAGDGNSDDDALNAELDRLFGPGPGDTPAGDGESDDDDKPDDDEDEPEEAKKALNHTGAALRSFTLEL